MKKWILLACAILSEVTGSLSLKAALGHPGWYALVVAGFFCAFMFLAHSRDFGQEVHERRFEPTEAFVWAPRQELQLTCWGDNVRSLSVAGTFDDCQRLVKAAFADTALRAAHRLTSANSINIGRLLPQMAYYAWAVLQLPASSPPPVVVVPSGNLGNLTAGVLAQRRGVPLGHFVAATTVNDPLPRYLADGVFRPRPATPTLANAMDVGHPSNFERLTWLFDDDVRRMRTSISGVVVRDAEIRQGLRELKEQFGYVADPHTAVGYVGAREAMRRLPPGAPYVILGTAHPAKFPEVVEPVLGEAVPTPPALAARLAKRGQAGLIGPHLSELASALRHGF